MDAFGAQASTVGLETLTSIAGKGFGHLAAG